MILLRRHRHVFIFSGDQEIQDPPVDKAYTKFSSVVGVRGWRIAIHERDTLPALFERGFDIEPGISTSISLTSTEISRLPHPYTDCVQDETVDNTNYIITTSFCRKKCMSRIIDRECGCIPADLVDYHHPDIKYCLALIISDPIQTFKRHKQNCQGLHLPETIASHRREG